MSRVCVYALHLTHDELMTVLGALEYTADKLSHHSGGDDADATADKAASSAENKARLLLECVEAHAQANKARERYRGAVGGEIDEWQEGPLPWEIDE